MTQQIPVPMYTRMPATANEVSDNIAQLILCIYAFKVA